MNNEKKARYNFLHKRMIGLVRSVSDIFYGCLQACVTFGSC